MSIEAREIVIGDTTYIVAQLGTKKGTALLVRLVKLMGPGLGAFVSGATRGAEGVDEALAQGVGEAIYDLASRLNEQEVAGVLEEFARQTTVVKSAELHVQLISIYDDHFAGRYDELLVWARFCMEVNYRSFFAGQSGGADKPLSRLWKALQAFQSRATSSAPGTSTASQAVPATPQA